MRALQIAFIVGAGLLSLGFFIEAACSTNPFDSLQSAVIFFNTFMYWLWFTLRYTYLVARDFREGIMSIPINSVTLVVGCMATRWSHEPGKWLLGLAFLMFMATLKDLEIIQRWRTNRHRYEEVRYHQQALLKDLFHAIVLTFGGITMISHLWKTPGDEARATWWFAIALGVFAVIDCFVKGRAVVRRLGVRTTHGGTRSKSRAEIPGESVD